MHNDIDSVSQNTEKVHHENKAATNKVYKNNLALSGFSKANQKLDTSVQMSSCTNQNNEMNQSNQESQDSNWYLHRVIPNVFETK